jgi:cytochrome c oxidase subunit III
MRDITMPEIKRNKIHPHKFALWISMASVMMMFGAFTSAYMVRQSAGNWLEFQIPNIFYLSTAVIVLSSVVLEASYRSFLREKEYWYKSLLLLTMVGGIAFIYLQYAGWMDLYAIGVELTGNPSGSFFYVISMVHAMHIVAGMSALLVAAIHAFGLPFAVTVRRKIRFELVVQFWHFLGALWIYLFFFLLMQ